MTSEIKKRTTWAETKASIKMYLALYLVYKAYRLLGATKKYATEQAAIFNMNAIMDRTIEQTGIADTRHKGKGTLQISLRGGPFDREIKHVEPAAHVHIRDNDGAIHYYRATCEFKQDSIIYDYHGIVQEGDPVIPWPDAVFPPKR